jgi:membrane protein implicated in regulation of membrane protease activity
MLQELVFWHWWILAAILLVGEMLTMTTYLFWVALAAIVVGIVKWLFPSIDWEIQGLIFAIWAILSVMFWWKIQKNKPLNKEQLSLNHRAEQNIGKVFTVEEAIENGEGKIRVGDSLWLARSDNDIAKGSKVKVIAAEGTALRVEKV